VIRWGELVVARRAEGESNAAAVAAMVASTTSGGVGMPIPGLVGGSVGGGGGKRGGGRRRGEGLVCDREVAEVVCDLVGCVRVENLLGGSDVLRDAAERGLLSRPW
jgi:hypothetical protein